MLKDLRFDIFELQETKLPVRLINITNEWKVVQGYEIPMRVKGDFEDVFNELDTMGVKGCNAQSWSKSWMKCPEFESYRRVRHLIKLAQDL
ncbi:hypothetical protein TNCV_3265581 [Trichonephila clavipes]|nr:hypothetical protein TNCV_3265581 [Trichonephila clavipes]